MPILCPQGNGVSSRTPTCHEEDFPRHFWGHFCAKQGFPESGGVNVAKTGRFENRRGIA